MTRCHILQGLRKVCVQFRQAFSKIVWKWYTIPILRFPCLTMATNYCVKYIFCAMFTFCSGCSIDPPTGEEPGSHHHPPLPPLIVPSKNSNLYACGSICCRASIYHCSPWPLRKVLVWWCCDDPPIVTSSSLLKAVVGSCEKGKCRRGFGWYSLWRADRIPLKTTLYRPVQE